MHYRNYILSGAGLAAIALAFSPVSASAEDASGDIVVTATGVPQDSDTVGQAITVLDRETIENRQTIMLSDLLATTPGLAVSRNGGLGGVTSVFVRGASSDQLLVLIDGVRVNDVASPSGAYNFGNLQTGSIDRVEILRGANSVIWGSQALGGVVNITTPQAPEDGVILHANGEYGDHETGQASATLGFATGPVRASISGAWLSTAGISATTADDERDNNDQHQVNGRLDVALADNIGVDLRGFYSRSYAELDSFNPTSVTRHVNGYAGLYGAFLDGALDLRAAYSVADTRRDYTSAFGPSRFTGKSERAELRGDWKAAEQVRFVFGAESEWTKANNSFLLAPQRARLSSVYGQVLLAPLAGLNLTAGVRHDDHRSFGGETSFGGNAVWRFGDTILRASYAEGFKAPALDQLFASYGNTALTPERARNIDAGIEQRLLGERLIARLTWFDRVTRDQIQFFSCGTNPHPLCSDRGAFGGYYLNIERTTADGVEAELTLKPTDALTLGANYSFVNARDRTAPNAGNLLPRRPRHSLNSSVDWSSGRVALGTTLSLVGNSFDNASNSTRLDGYALVSVRGSVVITDQISLYGRVENLFDTDYVTAFGFRSYGRSAFIGVRAKL
jgi:vitamin B12 transporter